MIVKEQEYKGNPLIAIYVDEEAERPIVSFGFKKAEAIVENINEIQDFVNKIKEERNS